MPVRKSNLKSYSAKGRKRGVSLSTRVRFQRPTAANQKRQIQKLSRQVAKNTRFVANQKVFTDWQWYQGETQGIARPLSTGTWYAWPLTDVAHWLPVLRQAQSTNDASKTYATRMTLNCRLDIGTVLNRAYFNVYLVTARRDHVNAIETLPGGNGDMTQLNPIEDYIDNDLNPGANVRINPAMFKVHSVKYSTLMNRTSSVGTPTTVTGGNPFTTYRKWQWNLPLKYTLRQPSGQSWRTVPFDQLPYYQKYYIMVYSTNNGGENQAPNLFVDGLTTCINF